MNVIDLEILIPASPEFIWRFMGDLSAIPQWHNDVVSVSFLSTQREGRGARWRQSTVNGSDVIVEISAWYDTLGYEYRVVDGTTFSDNQGRVRLHEVTDGTLVRWTFQYESRGVLGGLRNSMRLKRGTTNQIQESLRNLHQLIVQESGGISTHEAKATMQDAPDVRERSSYRPRHPSTFQEVADADGLVDEDTTLSEHLPLSYDLDAEPDALPVIAETDTKPNPVVLGTGLAPTPAVEPELEDTRPVDVETLLAELKAPDDSQPPIESAPLPEPPPVQDSGEDRPPATAAISGEQGDDSSRLSVFEIFGLQKPSEALAQATASGESSGASRDDSQRLESPAMPVAAANAADPPARQPHQEQAQQATDAARSGGRSAGWRRYARRRNPALRTHY